MSRLALLTLACALVLAAVSLPVQASTAPLMFTVEVTSSLAPAPVTVQTWMQEGLIRTESTTGRDAASRTITIVRDGKTYLLEPALKIAQVTPLRTEADAPEAQRKYWGLVDPLQVAPTHLPALFRELGARSLGTDKLDGVEVEALVLSIPPTVRFPIDNPRLYVKTSDGLPFRMDYRRNKDETVEVRFLNIQEGKASPAQLFEIPAEYRLVEYEW